MNDLLLVLAVAWPVLTGLMADAPAGTFFITGVKAYWRFISTEEVNGTDEAIMEHPIAALTLLSVDTIWLILCGVFLARSSVGSLFMSSAVTAWTVMRLYSAFATFSGPQYEHYRETPEWMRRVLLRICGVIVGMIAVTLCLIRIQMENGR